MPVVFRPFTDIYRSTAKMLFLLPIILTFYCSVGTTARSPESRIVGGHPVSITERPFQVLVLQAAAKNRIFKCGGAIINHRWILTAAHCTVGASAKGFIVKAGTDNLTDTDSFEQYHVGLVIAHENFTAAPNLSNDIALLKTTEDMEFGPTISSIKVRSVPPPASSEAVVSGFGVTQEGGLEGSNILMEVAVEILDQESCRDLLPHGSPLVLDDSVFCAAHLEGGKDSCQGDSGGPITIDDVLVGVVSWGIGCAREGVPAFYTDVSRYISWIADNIKANDSR